MRNTDPSVTFTGIAGHVAGISGHVPRNTQQLRLKTFFEPLRSLPFDDACVQTYGQLRAVLASKGATIGANGMLIAAVALTHGLTLVTHNTRGFGRIDGLKLEDWEVD